MRTGLCLRKLALGCALLLPIWVASAGAAAEVYSFGANQYGQLGQGDTTDRPTPSGIAAMSALDVLAASAGGHHSLLLLRNGAVYSFGRNWVAGVGGGQLGHGDLVGRSTPTRVLGLPEGVVVAAGNCHSLVVVADGGLFAFGSNNSGQLGQGDFVDRLHPTRVPGLGPVQSAAAGDGFSLVLLRTGEILSCGDNRHGQLGLGYASATGIPSPVKIEGLPGPAVAIAAGGAHALVLLENGDVYSFGRNDAGQLGLGDRLDRALPSRIAMLSGAAAVSAGSGHSLVLLANGELYVFGSNSGGQLGAGDWLGRPSPTRASGLPAVAAVSAGGSHSLIALQNGQLLACGSNASGALGIGHEPFRSLTPISVAGISGVGVVACGKDHSLVVAESRSGLDKMPGSEATSEDVGIPDPSRPGRIYLFLLVGAANIGGFQTDPRVPAGLFERHSVELASAMRDHWRVADRDIVFVRAWGASREEFASRLRDLASSTTPRDLLVLHYIGHGDAGGLMPGFGGEDGVLPFSDLDVLLGSAAGDVLVILDSCSATSAVDSIVNSPQKRLLAAGSSECGKRSPGSVLTPVATHVIRCGVTSVSAIAAAVRSAAITSGSSGAEIPVYAHHGTASAELDIGGTGQSPALPSGSELAVSVNLDGAMRPAFIVRDGFVDGGVGDGVVAGVITIAFAGTVISYPVDVAVHLYAPAQHGPGQVEYTVSTAAVLPLIYGEIPVLIALSARASFDRPFPECGQYCWWIANIPGTYQGFLDAGGQRLPVMGSATLAGRLSCRSVSGDGCVVTGEFHLRVPVGGR